MSSQAEVAAGLDRSFLWRRLHSVSGVFPIGAFLLEHLLTNFYATRGPEAYNEKVRFLAELPAVVALEALFIWIPLAYHGLYGVWIWWRGEGNVLQYPWAGNRLYTLQRWTGLLALAYIGFHVWEQRFAGVRLGKAPQPKRPVVAAGNDRPPVGRKGHGIDPARMAQGGADRLAGGRGPDPGRPV